jgi:hypothetical protein
MTSRKDDPEYVPATFEERRILRSLDHAFDLEPVGKDGERRRFAGGRAVQELFDALVRMGDKGYAYGASLFLRRTRDRDIPRVARAHMLTRFALGLRDADAPNERRAIRESEVAHAGRFFAGFVRELPVVVLEWAEDAGEGDERSGLEPQPTAVIRGVLLSPSFDQREAVEFWRMSAASKRFPERIFSDPCRSEDGAIFSSWHMRAFAIVFTIAPIEAVTRFVTRMRTNALYKMAKTLHVASGTWNDEVVPATENERLGTFRSIAGGIENAARRDYVTGLYGLS